jgi:hypothetical protein
VVRIANSGAARPMGVGQQTELIVPPNATVTLSAYYRVSRETALLQWKIDTTAYPRFGAAEFLERKERLSAGEWKRGSISVTNSTGAEQRVTGVSVSSNGFTGEVFLDNIQLELSPHASGYIEGGGHQKASAQARSMNSKQDRSRLRYEVSNGRRSGVQASRRSGGASHAPGQGWTLCGWSAPEAPPAPGSYACLAALERAAGPPLELRFRVDPEKSDINGWIGVLEVAERTVAQTLRRSGARETSPVRPIQMPVALAPAQALFWAVTMDQDGRLALYAAPAGYRLQSAAAPGTVPAGSHRREGAAAEIRTIYLGSNVEGEHPIHGLVVGGRFLPAALSLDALTSLQREPITRE